MSRQTKAYTSAYQTRDHESALSKGEVRKYACDFNGALNGETIASATWDCDRGNLSLTGFTVSGGVASVTITASDWGCAVMRAAVTTSAGRKLQQRFVVGVRGYEAPVSTVSWP